MTRLTKGQSFVPATVNWTAPEVLRAFIHISGDNAPAGSGEREAKGSRSDHLGSDGLAMKSGEVMNDQQKSLESYPTVTSRWSTESAVAGDGGAGFQPAGGSLESVTNPAAQSDRGSGGVKALVKDEIVRKSATSVDKGVRVGAVALRQSQYGSLSTWAMSVNATTTASDVYSLGRLPLSVTCVCPTLTFFM